MEATPAEVSEHTAMVPAPIAEPRKKGPRWHAQECGLHLIWEPDHDDIKLENQVEYAMFDAPMQNICANSKF
jgi:hypothetical protein